MQKPVTMRMLAKELGLSLSAVSKALNDYPDIGPETKALVLNKAAELGYSPNILARNLARKTSDFVGVVIRDITSIYGEMFKSLNAAARQYGLHLILYDTDNDRAVEKQCIQNLIDSMAMGIVITPVSEDVSEIVEMTRGRVPVVFLGGKATDDSVNYVSSDTAAGTEMALRYLIENGHRRIAMVCDHKQSSSRSRKLSVYRKLMAEIGEPERVFNSGEADQDILRAGYRQGCRLLEAGGDITAVFAVKDMMALGVIQALTEAGKRVPEQVSVIGYDGIDESGLPMVGLTTVAQPRMEMAEKIIGILRRHAENMDLGPEHYLAVPELVRRKSTARAAQT